jgi:hypothetical protein
MNYTVQRIGEISVSRIGIARHIMPPVSVLATT